MNTRIRSLGVAMVATFAVAAGCNKDSGTPTLLESRAQSYIPDIPVPKKFSRDEMKSTYSYTAGRRLVKDVYVGKDSMIAVQNFYSQYMPAVGWEELEKSLRNSIYWLKYRKGDERCEITIERTPSGLGEVTQVRATIRPEDMEAPE